jgi:hypothetical protein
VLQDKALPFKTFPYSTIYLLLPINQPAAEVPVKYTFMDKNEFYNLIFLDTNIYRQMGLKFYTHTHYKNLQDYCTSAIGEICVIQTVLLEFLSFYEGEINRHISSIDKAASSLKEISAFRKIQFPDLTEKINNELQWIKRQLTPFGSTYTSENLLSERQLIEFLISNKQPSKDNTRDFLIWLTVLAACVKNSSNHRPYRIILISNDKIYSDNPFLQKIKNDLNANNIELYSSIGNFLSDYTFSSPNLTVDTLLNSIDKTTLEQHLLKHSQEILREISYFYHRYWNGMVKPELLEIRNISMENFYSGKHSKDSDIVNIYGDIIMQILMVFEPEKDITKLTKYLKYERDPRKYFIETFDPSGRPVYDNRVSCITYFKYSISNNKIISTQFYEISADYDTQWTEIIRQYKQEQL